MHKRIVLLTTLSIVVLLLVSGSAGAQTPKMWVTAGAKGAIGGNYLSKPDDSSLWVGAFENGGGGIGGGGGIFGDMRFLNQHLGFEVDLLFDANKTWCNFNDIDFILKYTTMRIPILVKAGTQTGIVRISAGIGPEFRIGLSADTDLETDTGYDLSAFKARFTAAKRNDVALTWGVALGFMVSKIEITVDLRFAYNLTLPKGYLDRTHADPANNTMLGVEAGHTVDGRIMLGAGYVFRSF